MDEEHIVEGSVEEEAPVVTHDMVVQSAPSPTLFHTDDPVEVAARAARTATVLNDVLKRQNMVVNIQGRDHVVVEGWQTVGVMLGVTPVTKWSRPVGNEDGDPVPTKYEVSQRTRKRNGDVIESTYEVEGYDWEARVEARTLDGRVIGAGEAMVSRKEHTWAKRDDYALRSMAITRASSKALRGVLGFVVTMAGYAPTPAEEMPEEYRLPFGPEAVETTNAIRAVTYLMDGDVDATGRLMTVVQEDFGYHPQAVIRGMVQAARILRDEVRAKDQPAEEEGKDEEAGD